MSDTYISVKNLSFAYRDEANDRVIPVIRDLSLEIGRGEYVAILGHNGSGKSTLAKLLNFLLEPDEGTVSIDGKEINVAEISEDDLLDLRRKIGMVFQNPDNQLVATIVEEDVAFGPENLGVPSDEIRRRVDDAMKTVGMSEYAGHEPHRLSGGQKQRVAIAGIIAMMPECIIFDESTAMLDPLGRRDIMDTMERLNRENGITVLNITHYMNEAARADRVIVLNDGQLLTEGTPEEVFSDPETLVAAGLDVPQCVAVAKTLQREGLLPEGEMTTPEKCADLLIRAWGGEGRE